jgi:hypothetical protein
MFMVDPANMYRVDGSKITAPRQPSWKTEIVGLWVALRTDPSILLLFPMFLASVSELFRRVYIHIKLIVACAQNWFCK